jgi:hypothetical protein
VRPRIWRRFLITRSASFLDLHEAIQDACGWENYHLFAFSRGQRRYGGEIAGIPDEEGWSDPVPDAAGVKLADYFDMEGEKRCAYLYDFGDSWEHAVVLKGVVIDPERFTRRLIGGKRAFPREDSGGLTGYERYCTVLATGTDPWDEDVKELLGWLGGWEPEKFDLARAKARFDAPRLRRAKNPDAAEPRGKTT